MSDSIKSETTTNCELLMEAYIFYASNGDAYIVKPATFREVFSPESDFVEKIKTIWAALHDERKNQNAIFVSMLLDPTILNYIDELISKYVSKDGKSVTLSDLTQCGLNSDDVIAIIKKLIDVSGVNIDESSDSDEGGVYRGESAISFIALLVKETSMTINGLFERSLPFLIALYEQVNRVRMIEAGIDPEHYCNDNEEYSSSYSCNNEEESTLSDAEFYGQLNALMR